jgi:5-methylcytosine-specific restriction protein A
VKRTELKRKTPLKSGGSLKRGEYRRTPTRKTRKETEQASDARLTAVVPKPRDRPKRRNTGVPLAVRKEVKARAGMRCERCGKNLPRGGHIHHRRAKGMGGSRMPDTHTLPNLAFLCRECHQETHLYVTKAHIGGWIVWSWEDPAQIPVVPV